MENTMTMGVDMAKGMDETIVETFGPLEDVLGTSSVEGPEGVPFEDLQAASAELDDLIESTEETEALVPEEVVPFTCEGMPKDHVEVDFADGTGMTFLLDDHIFDCLAEATEGCTIDNIRLAVNHIASPNLIQKLSDMIQTSDGGVILMSTKDPRRLVEWCHYRQG